jgi:transcriptional regulator with XRE-family HTH domain
MNIRIITSKLFSKLKDKKYREVFIANQINKGIPFQMRALRAARQMTQSDLAERVETKQTVISRIENKGAGNLSVQMLLRLASAFDVGLVVRFEPIDKLIEWVDDLSPEVMAPESSELILQRLENTGKSLTSSSISLPTKSSATEVKALRVLPSMTTAIAVKSRAHKTVSRTLPLFDRPLGIVTCQTQANMETASELTMAQNSQLITTATNIQSDFALQKIA